MLRSNDLPPKQVSRHWGEKTHGIGEDALRTSTSSPPKSVRDVQGPNRRQTNF